MSLQPLQGAAGAVGELAGGHRARPVVRERPRPLGPAFGNIFTSDNDDDGNRGSRVIWVMEGGHYGYRTPGSARHWGEDTPGPVPKLVGTGNGSPCGVMVYEGGLLPDEYRGAVLEAEASPWHDQPWSVTVRVAKLSTLYLAPVAG